MLEAHMGRLLRSKRNGMQTIWNNYETVYNKILLAYVNANYFYIVEKKVHNHH
jgi:hypothetical protein